MNIRNIASRIGMDYETALEDYCGDVTALSNALSSFCSDCHIEKLENAIRSGSNEDIKKEAKRIRKLAEKAGLASLSEECHNLEKAEESLWNTLFSAIRSLCSEIISIIEASK